MIKTRSIGLFLSLLMGSSVLSSAAGIPVEAPASANEAQKPAEEKLKAADALWLKNSVKEAQGLYKQILATLPPEYEPFRALVVMRLAYAQYSQGSKADCLATLAQFDRMTYVPEHHLLAAKEMKAMVDGKDNPGLLKTPIPPLAKAGTTIFMNAEGNDSGDGSASRPVCTLGKAVDLVRKVRPDAKAGFAEIVLAPGTYRQERTIDLAASDDNLVIRSSDPANPAVISGGIVLSKWGKVTDKETLDKLPMNVRDRVLVCDLKQHGITAVGDLEFGGFGSKRAAGGDYRFKTFPVPELFFKGNPQTMARWPDNTYVFIPVAKDPKQPDQRYARWAKETDLWVYGYFANVWADAYEKIASIEPSGKMNVVQPQNKHGFGRNEGCVINALCELDQPGEWHLDSKKGLVHYLPPVGFDPKKCVLSAFYTMISASNCNNLQVRDLTVEYVRGDPMVFTNCSNLLLARVNIRCCSGLGIRVSGGKRHLIHSCTIDCMGRGGIDIMAGSWQNLEPSGSVIENCRISNISHIDRTYTQAIVIDGMGFKVRHNSFVNIPSSAIRVEASESLIELNYFNHCVYESGDQGAIDVWKNLLYRGNIIRWNDFDRIIGDHHGPAGVRLDDYISGFMVSENIFRKGTPRGGFGAIQFNQGRDNHFEGNCIFDWNSACTGTSAVGNDWNFRVKRNAGIVLKKADWESATWQKRYPMLKDLLNGDNSHNYMGDNRRFGITKLGQVKAGVVFADAEGSPDLHGETLASVKTVMVPWHPIPIDKIGPYAPDGK